MDDEKQAAPRESLIGADLSRLSLEEIGERIEALRAEIVRLEAAQAQKAASRAAADAFFRTA